MRARMAAAIDRREALRLGGAALLGASLSSSTLGKILLPPARSKRLFFEQSDVPRIRANARSILLGSKYREWAARSPQSLRPAWEQFRKTKNIISDLRKVWAAFEETAVVHLVEPTEALRRALVDTIEEVIDLPKWEYMMDGDSVLGVMRASMATSRMLFAREVLGDEMDADLDRRLLAAIADKGVQPCYHAVYCMDNPDKVVGWRVDLNHSPPVAADLSRWPILFGSNNLRGAPTMALGIGALALLGKDERAEGWLEAAENSAKTAFQLFSGDGSYFEGLSYSQYVLRTLLAFCEAHYRVKGTIDWTREMNFSGYVDYVAAMQAGKKADGNPDIVNFSDAAISIYPCVSSWIEHRTGNPAAQYATEQFAEPGYFLDYLWCRPNRPTRAPSVDLKNSRDEQDWIVCRSGWRAEDAVLAFRSGGPANHEHADRNSFFFKSYGERLLNDHFRAAYNSKDPGWTLRLTEAHNAVLIDGKGHQYHDGREGVCESQSEAKVVRWRDQGQQVWWSSDATQAYRLVNANVSKVLRTVLFAKPNVIVLLDQIELEEEASSVELRFFPDNRDGQADLAAEGDTFAIKRPGGTLFGRSLTNGNVSVQTQELDLFSGVVGGGTFTAAERAEARERHGSFPFIGVQAEAAKKRSIMTVLVARPKGSEEPPPISIQRIDLGWHFEADGVKGIVDTREEFPDVLWA